MTRAELEKSKAPFRVVSVHDRRRKAVVTGFTECDPLGVGFPTAYFQGGGWLIVPDLLRNYDLADRA